MSARFIQIHSLTSYSASLLNRDDAGFAKRIPFGGAVRTRVSSQCLKRHWRVFDGEDSLKSIGAPESIRSRVSFERYVVEPLVNEGVPEQVARAAAQKIIGQVFGSEAKQEKKDKNSKKPKNDESQAGATEGREPAIAKTEQVTVIGRPELDYLCQLARGACAQAGHDPAKVVAALDKQLKDKNLKENIKTLAPGSLEAGLGAALFGRMVTGDVLARTDAAIHVAHAMTVHGQLTESDYFSAIDDLLREDGELGSGHINAAELTSGLFYGYVVVDVEGLVSNLGGDRELAAGVTEKLVHLIAKVSPGAKKGSTAPYASSHLIMAEAGRAQPRTLANAFLKPVDTRGDLIDNTYNALADFLAEYDRMYDRPASEQRVHAGMSTGKRFGDESLTLGEVARWARARVLD